MVNISNYQEPEPKIETKEKSKIKICLHCGKEFTYKSSKKKFCSSKCTTQYSSHVQWKRKKSDNEYRKIRNQVRVEWGKRNKKKESAYISKWLTERSNKRRKKGLCVICGKIDTSKDKYKNCASCRDKRKAYRLKKAKAKEDKLKQNSN